MSNKNPRNKQFNEVLRFIHLGHVSTPGASTYLAGILDSSLRREQTLFYINIDYVNIADALVNKLFYFITFFNHCTY